MSCVVKMPGWTFCFSKNLSSQPNSEISLFCDKWSPLRAFVDKSFKKIQAGVRLPPLPPTQAMSGLLRRQSIPQCCIDKIPSQGCERGTWSSKAEEEEGAGVDACKNEQNVCLKTYCISIFPNKLSRQATPYCSASQSGSESLKATWDLSPIESYFNTWNTIVFKCLCPIDSVQLFIVALKNYVGDLRSPQSMCVLNLLQKN